MKGYSSVVFKFNFGRSEWGDHIDLILNNAMYFYSYRKSFELLLNQDDSDEWWIVMDGGDKMFHYRNNQLTIEDKIGNTEINIHLNKKDSKLLKKRIFEQIEESSSRFTGPVPGLYLDQDREVNVLNYYQLRPIMECTSKKTNNCR